MLDKGTRNRSRQQIKEEFDRLKAQVVFGSSANSITASITTTRANLPATLRLVAEVLKEPSFDAAEFEKLRAERLAGIEQGKTDPLTLGGNRIARTLWPYPRGHPLATQSIEEQLDDHRNITVNELKRLYSELVGASYGVFAVVGDFATDSVTDLANEMFGSWRSPRPFARLVHEYRDVTAFSESIETPDKASAALFLGQSFRIHSDSKEYAAFLLGNRMLGGSASARLVVRNVREGLSYRMGTGITNQALDGFATFTTLATYNPVNVLRVHRAIVEEITRALRDGFAVEELEQSRRAWLQGRMQNRSDDASLANMLANQAVGQRTMSDEQRLEAWVAELTVDEVNAAMRKYIDPSKISMVKAGDFANNPPKP
jgi:zinc protease